MAPSGHELRVHVAGVLWDRRGRCRNVEDYPVPPAAAGRRIRIVDRDGEALGPLWRASAIPVKITE